MNFIVIFGPPASGKMTVGQELTKITDYKLFHNHMTIDLVLNFFDWDNPKFHKLVKKFRMDIFNEVVSSELKGFIFTYVWAFNEESDKNFIDEVTQIFKDKNWNIFYVELETDLETRIERNKTENRLYNKTSKRNIEASEKNLLFIEDNYKMNTNDDFYYQNNYIKINNTNLSASDTAKLIKEKLL